MLYQIQPSPGLLILLCSVSSVFCLCPLKCSCYIKNRNVDCSGRSLTALPHGLQDNITHLNLSYNSLSDLDHQLSRFTNLRSLDLSHNLLKNLPSHLPRSLWEVYAANNNIKVLHKLDTAYQWNLRVLDVSRNSLQRTVFINNTLISLQSLNLSNNQLWTVPTNMPSNILLIDLSYNSLIQILSGTFVRMPKLQTLYLHNNRFAYIPNNAFDHLTHVKITLYNNPWSCEDTQSINYLLKWVEEKNNIIGYPCANETNGHSPKHHSTTDKAPNKITSQDIPLQTTSHSLFMEAQESKLHKKRKYPEVLTAPHFNATDILLSSTESNLFIEGGSGMMHLDFNNFGREMDNHRDSNEIEVIETYDHTIMLSSDNTAHNGPEVIVPSTPVYVMIQATTIILNDHAPSTEAQKCMCIAISLLLLLLILRTV
ncbi:oligodendrocyte-myelin glycoprotein [Pseudophryne corroboree]|uniref:oligodendrocyte-myelin glycoprotein n=1 Tax=Pseudophryne corroboree TaxID=495146 RepID=UPI0030815CA4